VQTVILTLGSAGAYVAAKGVRALVPAFKVKPVDTTAAGDIFNGALAVALLEGKPLLDAVRFANAAAALSVTKLGAQSSAPTRAQIEGFLKRSR
jgi:ribokinase